MVVTVCDTPYWTGGHRPIAICLTHFATLYALLCRRILHATLPAILMMMDMMGLRKSSLVLLLLRCHTILFHVSLYLFFLWRKKTHNTDMLVI